MPGILLGAGDTIITKKYKVTTCMNLVFYGGWRGKENSMSSNT